MSDNRDVARLAAALEKDPDVAQRFSAGATSEDIAALRAAVGVELPADMLAFHAFRDGLLPQWEGDGTILGYSVLGCRRIVDVKAGWDELAATYEGMSGDDLASYAHYGLWRRAWVPLQDNDHEVVALATEACFDGPAGQVVRFDFKGGAGWTVEHASYGDWLRTLTEIVEAGLCDSSRGDEEVESIWARVNPRARWVARERPALSAEAQAALEAEAARAWEQAVTEAQAKVTFQPGDPVNVVSGPFAGIAARFVDRVEGTTRVRLEVRVFGRLTEAEVEIASLGLPG